MAKNPTPRARPRSATTREESRDARLARSKKEKPRAKRVVPSTQSSRERIWCWESFFCRLLLLLSRDKDERDAKEIVVGCLNRSAVQVNNTIIAGRVCERARVSFLYTRFYNEALVSPFPKLSLAVVCLLRKRRRRKCQTFLTPRHTSRAIYASAFMPVLRTKNWSFQ